MFLLNDLIINLTCSASALLLGVILNEKRKLLSVGPLKRSSIFGLNISPLDQITASSPQESLLLVNRAFEGEKSAVQDMIALNSGAALYIANIVNSMSDGVEMAFDLMNKGLASQKLSNYVKVSNES